MVERHSRLRGLPSNPLTAIQSLTNFVFTPHCLRSLSCINEYLTVDSEGIIIILKGKNHVIYHTIYVL